MTHEQIMKKLNEYMRYYCVDEAMYRTSIHLGICLSKVREAAHEEWENDEPA